MTNLISGKEALIALANGEYVQLRPKIPNETWEDLSGRHSLDIFGQGDSYEFRLKPTLNDDEFNAALEQLNANAIDKAYILDGYSLTDAQRVAVEAQ